MSSIEQLQPQLLDDEGRATFLTHFLGAHRAFRRDAARFPVALRCIGTEPEPGWSPEPGALRRHWLGYEATLAHHHHMEDELLFPRLRAVDRSTGAVIDELVVQHHQLDGRIAEAREALARLEAPDAVEPAVRACVALAASLDLHLDLEEEQLVPIMRATMLEPRPDEAAEPGESHDEHAPPDDEAHRFVLPWMADGLDHVTVTALLDGAPSSVATAFPRWRAAYNDQLHRWWW